MSIQIYAPKKASGQAILTPEAHFHAQSSLPLKIFIGESSIDSRYALVREIIENASISSVELIPLETIEFINENSDITQLTVFAGNPNTNKAYKIDIQVGSQMGGTKFAAQIESFKEFSTYHELYHHLFGFNN